MTKQWAAAISILPLSTVFCLFCQEKGISCPLSPFVWGCLPYINWGVQHLAQNHHFHFSPREFLVLYPLAVPTHIPQNEFQPIPKLLGTHEVCCDFWTEICNLWLQLSCTCRQPAADCQICPRIMRGSWSCEGRHMGCVITQSIMYCRFLSNHVGRVHDLQPYLNTHGTRVTCAESINRQNSQSKLGSQVLLIGLPGLKAQVNVFGNQRQVIKLASNKRQTLSFCCNLAACLSGCHWAEVGSTGQAPQSMQLRSATKWIVDMANSSRVLVRMH